MLHPKRIPVPRTPLTRMKKRLRGKCGCGQCTLTIDSDKKRERRDIRAQLKNDSWRDNW